MECMMAYGGNNILDLTLSKVYQKYPAQFRGSGTASGFNYSFEVTKAPTATLVAGVATHNIVISLANTKITVTAASGAGPGINQVLPFKAKAKLRIVGGVLSITGLTVFIDNPTGIDALIVAVINAQVVPKLQQTLNGITLPQLDKLFGSSLSPQVRTGQVISGPALEIGARFANVTNLGTADAPPQANITSLNNGTATNALVIGMVSDDAVNKLIKPLIPPLSDTFNKSGSIPGFGAGIKGTIRATTPVLTIVNGVGKAKTTVSVSLQAGIKVPIFGWTWKSIPVPDVEVVVNNALSTSGNKATLTLTGISSLHVELDWPGFLSPVESLVEGMLDAVVNLFKGKINNAVAGKKFDLFTLPSTIPGTSLGATLSFETNGLSYSKGSVKALVRVKT